MGKSGKKANKHQKHTKDHSHKDKHKTESGNVDTTAGLDADGCLHVPKAIRVQTLRGHVAHLKFGHCKVCGKGLSRTKDNLRESETLIKDVCICLRCGHQACSRQCKQQHAYQHYLTTPSHCIAVNILTWSIWCYECDKELIPSSESSVLTNCIKHIKAHLPSALEDNGTELLSQGQGGKITEISLSSTSFPAKGLKNLGNTCFFNSVIQNLAQTRVLKDALKDCVQENRVFKLQSSDDDKDSICGLITTGPGMITQALKDLLTEFARGGQKILSPGRLFGEISKRAPQFRGYQQHDSQELLRYLLDGMKTEELKRIEHSVKNETKGKDVAGKTKAQQLQGYMKNARTFVDEIFGGVLVSTVVCHSCKKISQVYDGFLDLSLPVSESEKQRSSKEKKKIWNEKENTRSQADLDKGEEQKVDPENKDKKLSKHQKKVQARLERKAKRAAGKISSVKEKEEQAEVEPEEVKDEVEVKKDDSDVLKTQLTEKTSSKESSQLIAKECMPANYDYSEHSVRESEDTHQNCPTYPMSHSDPNADSGTNIEPCKPESPIFLNAFAPSRRKSNQSDVSADLSDDDRMEEEEHMRLSALAMEFFNSMVEQCGSNTTVLEHEEEMEKIQESGGQNGLLCTDQLSNCDVSELDHTLSELDSTNILGKVDCEADSIDLNALSFDGNQNDQIVGKPKDLDSVPEDSDRHCRKCTENISSVEDTVCRVSPEGGASGRTVISSAINDIGNDADVIDSHSCLFVGKENIHVTDVKAKTELNVKDTISVMERAHFDTCEEDVGFVVGKKSNYSGIVTEVTQKYGRDSSKSSECELNTSITSPSSQMCSQEAEKGSNETDERFLGQLETIFNRVISEDSSRDDGHCDSNSSVSSSRNQLTEDVLKDECDSGFSSVGEICPDSGTTAEEIFGEIEDLSELEVPESSVLSCLRQFCDVDILDGRNKFGCENCYKLEELAKGDGKSSKFILREATKQLMIFRPPKILTLHLKRFAQTARQLRKVNRPIQFPLELDVTPFCHKTAKISKGQVLYKLYGLVEHSGSLHGGHYVAYVRGEIDGKWYYISDARVSTVSEEIVLRKQAYLLFYEQVSDCNV